MGIGFRQYLAFSHNVLVNDYGLSCVLAFRLLASGFLLRFE